MKEREERAIAKGDKGHREEGHSSDKTAAGFTPELRHAWIA